MPVALLLKLPRVVARAVFGLMTCVRIFSQLGRPFSIHTEHLHSGNTAFFSPLGFDPKEIFLWKTFSQWKSEIFLPSFPLFLWIFLLFFLTLNHSVNGVTTSFLAKGIKLTATDNPKSAEIYDEKFMKFWLLLLIDGFPRFIWSYIRECGPCLCSIAFRLQTSDSFI